MAFQEQLAEDTVTVFLPTMAGRGAEFDGVIEIGWKDHDPAPVSCILDESEGQHAADGVTQWDATLQVAAVSVPLFEVNSRLTIIDRDPAGERRTRRATVAKAADDYGMLVFGLIWYGS